jgi:CheY-like chemotaxis protein
VTHPTPADDTFARILTASTAQGAMSNADAARTVLLVEDSRADAELVVDAIEQAASGVAVQVVSDGFEALAFLQATETNEDVRLPDLVFLDLNLPRLGGLAVLGRLQHDSRLNRAPVIVLTTSRAQADIQRSYDLGAVAVVNKPMRLSELRDVIRELCDQWLGSGGRAEGAT